MLLLCVGGCLYRVVDIVWFTPAIRISPETTVVEGPLGPDGFIDYCSVLNERMSDGVTPDNNAGVLLIRALGPGTFDHVRDGEYYRLLEMEPPASDGPRLVDSGEFLADGAGTMGPVDAHLLETMTRPWTREEFPQSAAWVDANSVPLELAVRATERDRFYIPVVPRPGTPGLAGAVLSGQHRFRAIARVLVSRSMLRLGEGDLTGADADLVACHRLASLVGQPTLITDNLVAISIDGVAAQGDAAILADPRLTPELARHILNERQALPPLPDMADTVDVGERFIMIDSVCGLVRGKTSAVVGATPIPLIGIDGNRVLPSMNETCDKAVHAMRIEGYAQRTEALKDIERDLKARAAKRTNPVLLTASAILGTRATSSRQATDTLLALLTPVMVQAHVAEDRGTAHRRLLLIGCALAIYRAEHGEYPAELDVLAPDLLETVPPDPFGDKPFIYQRGDDGRYRLYSVGRNLQDDNGVPEGSESDGDDIPLQPAVPP